MLVLPEPLRPTMMPICQSSSSIGKEPLKCFSNLTSQSVKLPTTLCALKLSAWSQRFTTSKSVAYNPPTSTFQRCTSDQLHPYTRRLSRRFQELKQKRHGHLTPLE